MRCAIFRCTLDLEALIEKVVRPWKNSQDECVVAG